VSDSMIGIKLADGSFYPILEEKRVGKKKLILTTARENQRSVQIDLYRGSGESLLEAVYIGSLVIENLNPKPAGSAEIELIVGISEEGLLNAKAGDKESGEYQNLSVSMDTIAPQEQFDLPDLDLEGVSAPDIVREEEDRPLPEETRLYGEEEERIEAPKRRPFFLIGFIVIALLIIGILMLLIFRSCRGEDQRPLKAGDTTPPAATAPAQPALQQSQQPAVSPAPQPQTQPAQQTQEAAAPQPVPAQPAPQQSQPEPQQPRQDGLIVPGHPEAPEGVWYKIVWGDTLWDISIAFYRTPWLYGKIAKINSIPNPDRIYAGRRLFIPQE